MPDTPDMLLSSPDRRVELRVALGDWSAGGSIQSGALWWRVSFADRVMLRASRLSILLAAQPPLMAGFELERSVRQRRRRIWEPDAGAAAQLTDDYNALVLRLRAQAEPARCFDLIFRCYDAGVAVGIQLPRLRGIAHLPRVGGTLRFPTGTQACDGAPQPRPLEELDLPCDRSCTLSYMHGRLARVVSENAAAVSHISKYVRKAATGLAQPMEDHTLQRVLPRVAPQHTRAWLVLLLAERPVDLPAQSGLLLNLGMAGELPGASLPDDDAAANCLTPFGIPARDRQLQIACPATPAHRLAADVVRGAAAVRWDETRFLRGEIGAYLVVARRLGGVWQVGGITGAEGRILTVRLEDFLARQAAPYALEVARDPLPGEPAAADGVVRETFAGVEAADAPRLELPPGGGFLLRLTPEAS